MDTDKLLKNNHFFSSSYGKLAEVLENNPVLCWEKMNCRSDLVESFMHNYDKEHSVSPWPCIVDKKFVEEVDCFIKQVPVVIYKLLSACHAKGLDSFCDYLNVSPLVYEFFSQYKLNVATLPVRYDAVVSDGCFKLIELNCGTSLGGWQHDWLHQVTTNILSSNESLSSINIAYHRVCESMFRAICIAISQLTSSEKKGNILYVLPNRTELELESIQNAFQSVYREVRPSSFSNGSISFISSLSDIEITADGYIYYGEEVQDAILFAIDRGNEIPESFYCRMQSASLKGHFYYGDDSNFKLIGNKNIFSLMHDPEYQDVLSREEQRLVKKIIPWTAKLNKERVEFSGVEYEMDELVETKKDQLILKKSHSMQGKDVVIGRSLSQERWLQQYELYKEDNDWSLQEYCSPDKVIGADPFNGFSSYRMVWGIFSLAGKYGGSFLRGVKADSNSTIINSAQGAIEFLVFEEQKLKNKIKI